MPRLAPVKRRRLLAVLRSNGLVDCPERAKGSHVWFQHPDDPSRHTTVPDHDTIPVGTLHVIISQAGKDRKGYLRVLEEVG